VNDIINTHPFGVGITGWCLRACKKPWSKGVRSTQGSSYWWHHWGPIEGYIRTITQHPYQADGRRISGVCSFLRNPRWSPLQNLVIREQEKSIIVRPSSIARPSSNHVLWHLFFVSLMAISFIYFLFQSYYPFFHPPLSPFSLDLRYLIRPNLFRVVIFM
jgi:hypothetical protein